MTKKVKDAVKQVAAKVEKLKKKNDKPSVNNKPVVKPTVSVSEKNDDHNDVNEKNDSAVDDDTAVSKYMIISTGCKAHYYFFVCVKTIFF